MARSGFIPFNRAALTGREREYLEQSLRNMHVSSGGPYSAKVSELLAQACLSKKVLPTTSCTDALELSALLLDIAPGDEVIMPSFTFVSTANAFALRGGKPVFVDVRPDTFNIDERAIERAITPRTKAIVVVHYAGIGCEMDAICEIARKHQLPIVEDNAHGLFGRYRGRPLGSFGAMSTLSFHETKNFSCGEGGALCINDERFSDRAEVLHAKGTNRARFLRGMVDKYTWVDVGSSFGLSDLLAAILYGQLEQRERITQARRALFERYMTELAPAAKKRGWVLPHIPSHCESPYHLFGMLTNDIDERDALIAALKQQNILAVFHYVPLHTSDVGARLGYHPGDFPVTENVSSRLVRLPFFNTLSRDDHTAVIEAVNQFAEQARS